MTSSLREPIPVKRDVAPTTDWVSAAEDICREILADAGSGVTADPHQFVVDRVFEVAAADLVTYVVPGHGDSVQVQAAAGYTARDWRGRTVPIEGTLTESVVRTGRGRVLADVNEHLGDNVRSVGGLESVLLVPLREGDTVRGMLTIGRRPGARRFTNTDLAVVSLLAGQVSMALQQLDERRRVERAVLAAERDRMAGAMHGEVIQRLFTLGMTMQAAAGRTTGAAARHLENGSDEIDETIKAIRAAIYRVTD